MIRPMCRAMVHASRGSRPGRSPAYGVTGTALAVAISVWSSAISAQPAAGSAASPEAPTAINVLLFGKAAPPPMVPAAHSELKTVRSLNPLSELNPADLTAFRGRPLFAPSRRPIPPPAQVVAVPVVVPPPAIGGAPDLRLVGIVAISDESVAILRRPSGGSALPLRVGDAVDEWRVASIAAESVLLRNGDREHSYVLFSRKSNLPGAVAPTVPSIAGRGISSILLRP